jgi:hypothetical protein
MESLGKVALRQVFFPEYFVFPCQFQSTAAPLHGKPQGCGASVASAAGPFTTKMYMESKPNFILGTLSEYEKF